MAQFVGHAIIDPDLDPLRHVSWLVNIPVTIRRLYNNRPDLVLAALREDEHTLARCKPYFGFCHLTRRYTVPLARIALYPQLVPFISSFAAGTLPADYFVELLKLIPPTGRVIHASGSLIDCRRGNLRPIAFKPLGVFPSGS